MLSQKQGTRSGAEVMVDFGPDDYGGENIEIDWVNKQWVKRVLRLFALISLVSVCLNTPVTFVKYPSLEYATFCTDLLVTFIFTAEMMAKVHVRGLWKGENAYLRDRWCQFDGIMALFLWVSVLLQMLEITGLLEGYQYLRILRAPRPLIMIRFIRVFLKFSMPKARINMIFKRSSQQIYNVTLFFTFFMSLYGLLGVQFFGELRSHCVRMNTTATNVTVADLAIPDTYCSHDNGSGYQCPSGTECLRLELSRYMIGFNGFDEFCNLFTVYQAASQEAWTQLLYRTLDSLPTWRAMIYFVTLIFFLAWLVKNVFIAVITETFNEIRVQFKEMWGVRDHLVTQGTTQVLGGEGCAWKMVAVDDSCTRGHAPKIFVRILHSAGFHVLVMLALMANAMIAASIHFKHDGRPREDFYYKFYYIEMGFTGFFLLEALFKMWCLGVVSYMRRSVHKFELLLVIGTIVHLVPALYMSAITFFQAFMSMFQILTQEGWIDVMNETMLKTSPTIAPVVAIYFICYHLFVTLIVLSLFVAVILDNLELDEDIKKLKQMKAREQSVNINEKLPLRIRIFQKFPDSPQMIKLHKLSSDFPMPKVRDSFLRQFVDEYCDNMSGSLADLGSIIEEEAGLQPEIYHKTVPVKLLKLHDKSHSENADQKKLRIQDLLEDSSEQRLLLGDSGQIPVQGIARSTQSIYRRISKRVHRQSIRGSVRLKPALEHLKENGFLGGRITDGSGGGGLYSRHGAWASGPNTATPNMHRRTAAGTTEATPTAAADFDIKMLQAKRQQAEMRRSQREEDLRENHPLFDTPLFAVGRESKFRRMCQRIVYARFTVFQKDPVTGKELKIKYKRLYNLLGLMTYLDWAIFLITILSCVSMVCERPDYRIVENPSLQVAEYAYVVFTSVELVLKILADGLFFTPKALIRDFGGILDIFIYVVSLTFIIWQPRQVPSASGAQLLMMLRCLRPLRIFSLVPHMRKVVAELCRGFKEIVLVSVLLIVLIFIFASYGVQLFGGRLARCNDPNILARESCKGIFFREVYVTKMKLPSDHGDVEPNVNPGFFVPRVWANPYRFNFDNIGNAMLALFEVLSFKGWLDIRDIILRQLGPLHAIYIHIYVFLGCMIGVTLFVGVVIANYSQNKGTALLTVDQRRWCDLKKRLKIAQPLHLPPRPEGRTKGRKFRTFVYDITQHIYFKRFIAFLVIMNSSLLFFSWREEEEHTVPLAWMSFGLNLMFVVEVVMKCIAFTPRGYWQSRRNRYDLFVTAMGVVWMVMHFMFGTDISHSFGFVVIILRFFTITGKHATLRMLMLTVVVSVYKSFFIIMGLFLLILTYGLIGNILFGNIRYMEGIHRLANFQTAPNGITMLFRIVTGEDWNKIMHNCMVQPPFCTHGQNYWETDCGHFTGALIYFCSFYVIITYIVLNLLVAIIMENFSLFYSSEEDALLSYADIRNFQNTWNVVDTNQRGMIPIRRVKFILRLLKGRLEVDLDRDRMLFKHMCYELERLRNGDDVTFHDVLNMLSYRSVDIRKSLQMEELLAREELEYIIEEEVAKQTIRNWLQNCLKRIRTKEQSSNLLAGLRATNEPILQSLQEDRLRAEKREMEKIEPEKPELDSRSKRKITIGRSDSIASSGGAPTGSAVRLRYLAASMMSEGSSASKSDRSSRFMSAGRRKSLRPTEGFDCFSGDFAWRKNSLSRVTKVMQEEAKDWSHRYKLLLRLLVGRKHRLSLLLKYRLQIASFTLDRKRLNIKDELLC
ncbi:unnamed protein product [Notodromas monacha]|uniref:Sodium leak channel NALCN n=1 Tax=Notodromas monacha TaxID=399045 RepID=A0A7R9BGP2_9CRUS|nr:unnamed protein product [Notodromas monacha]CAG0914974.1 unnamed protein product [Notodromas monacha]